MLMYEDMDEDEYDALPEEVKEQIELRKLEVKKMRRKRYAEWSSAIY